MSVGCQIVRAQQALTVPLVLITLMLPTSIRLTSSSPRGNGSSGKGGSNEDGKCELVGTFSLITQAFLGLLCLSSLIIKRFYEYPVRRTWPVWMFDVSKQLIGALGVHIFNVLLSILKSENNDNEIIKFIIDDNNDESSGDLNDPCNWYFLNIVFDCTIGVYVLYLVFKAANKFCKSYLHITQIQSGDYGPDPNKPSIHAYWKQLTIYFTSLMITKFILYGIVECFETQILWVIEHIILAWLDKYPEEVEIFMVMFIVPIVMNCLQLVLVDNFIRNQVWSRVNDRIQQEAMNGTVIIDDDESFLRQEIANLANQETRLINPHKSHRYSMDSQIVTHSDSSNSTIYVGENFKSYGSINHDRDGEI
ncbi:vacuolar membrane protein-domain-containing protein [Scheffersomyces amazonensis]|uniref:vacuolar membrane protein-domain-containing protein n=1 Tax=Scheffersomyces amazonensis TaxID=1078765 RepID=UPI00315DAEB6